MGETASGRIAFSRWPAMDGCGHLPFPAFPAFPAITAITALVGALFGEFFGALTAFPGLPISQSGR